MCFAESHNACRSLACVGYGGPCSAPHNDMEPVAASLLFETCLKRMVSASAFFLSRACPFTAPVRRPFMTASTVTVGTTLYLFCVDMVRLPSQQHLQGNHCT